MAAANLVDSYDLFVNGSWVAPGSGRYDVINPATEEVIASAPDAGTAQVEQAIAAARTAFDTGPWATATPEERSRCLQQLSDALLAHGDEIYALAQAEWGCTANERLIHVDGPAFMAGHAAELALESAEAPMDAWGAAGTTLLRYEPLGVVAVMTPWNFPHTLNVMKRVRERAGNRHRHYAQGVYRAQGDDDWVAVSVRDDTDWAAMTEVIGRPDLRDDPRFVSADARLAHHDEFDEAIAECAGTRSAEEFAEALLGRGVPAQRLMTSDRMYDVDQLDARGFYEDLDHRIAGRQRFPGWPFRITPGPSHHHRSPSPTLGQHNDEVLGALGLTSEELVALREQQVIGERLPNA